MGPSIRGCLFWLRRSRVVDFRETGGTCLRQASDEQALVCRYRQEPCPTFSLLPITLMLIKIILVFKMIGWFFIEIYELLTGKRKFMQEHGPQENEPAEDDFDDDDAEH